MTTEEQKIPVNNSVDIQSNVNESVDTFEALNLKEDLLRGIYGYGFEKPSAIQQKGIKPLLQGKDTISQAQSGTGKTATFVIATLQIVDEKVPNIQAIILSPTRELAQQTHRVTICLAEHLKTNIHLSMGGTEIRDERDKLKKGGVQVVVGTPGRIIDLIQKDTMKTNCLKLLIIDEADLMLSKGFQEDIRKLFVSIPGTVQVGLFSATMSPEILDITKQFMRDPATILVKNEELTLEGIKQYYIASKEDTKFQVLVDLFQHLDITQCIMFCNSKKKVDELAQKLTEQKFTVSQIHGEMKQKERSEIMLQFKSGASRILVSSDLLNRGIDIQQVNIVINYDLPQEKEKYIHRIGRAGRYGRRGIAVNFITENDVQFLKAIEKFYNTEIIKMPSDLSKIFD